MFCAPGLVFYGTEGVGSCFHVLRVQTRFSRYRGHWVPFSCFALLDSFSTIPSSSVSFSCFETSEARLNPISRQLGSNGMIEDIGDTDRSRICDFGRVIQSPYIDFLSFPQSLGGSAGHESR
jgi:hypothetical protein